MEGDPVNPYTYFSEVAEKAQAFVRVLASSAHRSVSNMCACRTCSGDPSSEKDHPKIRSSLDGTTSPLQRFGCSFKRRFIVEYTRRHTLETKVDLRL